MRRGYSEIIKKAGRIVRQLGWVNAPLYALDRLLSAVSNDNVRLYKYYLVAQPVTDKPLLPSRRGNKIEIRHICEHDDAAREFPRPATAIRARFEQGATCLAAYKEGRFIGYLWLTIGSYQEDEVRARFTPLPERRTAWDFDVYVAPEHRVGFTFLRLWDEANRVLAGNDVQWSCSRISAFNPGSRESHARLGTVALGSAVFLCAARWQLMFSGMSPYLHVSPNPACFPEFHLNIPRLADPLSPRGA